MVSSKSPCGQSRWSCNSNDLHCVVACGECRGTECENCEKQEASTYDTNQAENFDDNACHNLFLNHYPSYAFQIWFNRFSI